jgi:hypothetical protein
MFVVGDRLASRGGTWDAFPTLPARQVGFSEEVAMMQGQGIKMQIVNLLKAFRLLRREYKLYALRSSAS